QTSGAVKAPLVGKCLPTMHGRPEYLDHGAHLRHAARTAYVSENRSWLVRSGHRKHQAYGYHQEPELTDHCPPRGRSSALLDGEGRRRVHCLLRKVVVHLDLDPVHPGIETGGREGLLQS